MTQVIVGKWGKNLAIRVPIDIARALELRDGEEVEIAAEDGNIVIRRPLDGAMRRRAAERAAAGIIAARKGMSLGGLSIQELRDEGRR